MMAFFALLFFQSVTAYYLQLGSVSLLNSQDYLNDRVVTLSSGVIQYYNTAYFGSRNNSGSDGIYGSVYSGGQAYQGSYQSPSSQLGFFANYAKWNANNPVNGDYSSSTGFIATSYLKLEEVDGTDAVVQTVYLNTMPWVVSAPYSNGAGTSVNLTGGLPYTGSPVNAFGGGGGNNNNNNNNQNQNQNNQQANQNQNQNAATTLYGNLSVTLVVTVSSQNGVLFTGGGLITSKSVGLDIEILFFPYTNSNNKIRLSEVVATATTSNTVQNPQLEWNTYQRMSVGQTDVTNGVSGVYVDLAKNALVNGQSQPVTISTWSATYNDMKNYKLYAIQLTNMAKAGRQVQYFGYSVLFPSNGVNITYSQVLGTGNGPDANLPTTEDEVGGEEQDAADPQAHAIGGLSKEAFGGVIAGTVMGLAILTLAIVWAVRSRQNKDYPVAINDTTNQTNININKTEGMEGVETSNENSGLVHTDGSQHNKYQALS